MPITKVVSMDKVWLTGLIMIVISLFLFNYPALFMAAPANEMGLFMLNYLFVILYFIVLLASGRLRRNRNGLAPLFSFLVLFLISAFGLNREMNIFDQSADWWSVMLVICCLNYLTLPFFERLPLLLQHLVCLWAGVSLVMFCYLLIYLMPVYAFGVLFSIFLGISLHCFVPLLFFIYTIVFIRRAGAQNRKLFRSWWAGVFLALLVTILFIIRWIVTDRNITRHYKKEMTGEQLPAWVTVAQHLSRGPVTEKLLKTGLVYNTYSSKWDFFQRRPSRNFGDNRRHDPLVILATLFAGEPVLTEDERVKVLESLYDSRHQAQERLWRGDDLCTQKVKTSVQLWPGLHLAYTEKKITILNKAIPAGWRDQQEAIYTFHLPEGAVVSSLSLWINGKEEKGLLTTREKADSAYTTIVGHERRDPSVVHWQEGNTVSVRVFPVVAGESRLFTIGITAPLEKKGTELIYRNIFFDGPSPGSATESISIRSEDPLPSLVLPSFFPSGNDRTIQREGKYQADWILRFREKGLDKRAFVFDGQQYTVGHYYKQREGVDFRQVYLDVNKSWTRGEFETIAGWVQSMTPEPSLFVYVPGKGMQAVTPSNEETLFRELSVQQFSIFPLFGIGHADSSLLISRNPPTSPSLADIDVNNDFLQRTREYLSGGGKPRLFCLGGELSPYLTSLKEFRAFRYEEGGLDDLHELLDRKEFARDPETDQQVVIDAAALVIGRSELSAGERGGTGEPAGGMDEADAKTAIVARGGTALKAVAVRKPAPPAKPEEPGPDLHAPDHVLRLFAYNHILQRMGGRLIHDPASSTAGEQDKDLLAEAQLAHIVSPVSSLVVLEKQEDYDRFNIQDSKNSLKNASLQAKGSVPEPGEWALLLLVLLTFLYVKFQSRFRFAKDKTRHS